MQKEYLSVEEMITDEDFLSWYHQSDKKKVEEWESRMNADPAHRSLTEEAVQLLRSFSIREEEISSSQLESAHEQLLKTLNPEEYTSKLVNMPRRYSRWWWAAAVILILAAGAYFLSIDPSNPSLETAYGEISQKHLPDGSEIFLNANSEIKYTDSWKEGKDREVWIRGEAYFKVAKTPDRSRFIVHTGNFDVIVTGTQFNVMNRDDRTNVALTEGSVIIKTNDGNSFTMKPGDFFEIKDKKIVQKTIEKENVMAWQQKKLVFNNTPMKDIVRDMEALYGVKVNLQNEAVGNSLITGMIPNDNLEVLLKALEATEDFKVTRKGNEVLISLP